MDTNKFLDLKDSMNNKLLDEFFKIVPSEIINLSSNRFGKVNIIKKQTKEGKQEMIAECSLKDATKTEYISVHMQSSIESMNELTPVQKFYNGQSIFITGGTGCLGKLIIEKLLRECHGITCTYLLIRTKKGKSILQHTKGLFENTLFSTLRKKHLIFQNRIVAIEGDCSLPNFSISVIDRAIFIREVLIVFNVTATVKFNETIKLAIVINVRSLKDAINLSKEMPKLKSFVYVSTVYFNYLQNPIEEKFYDPLIDADKLINLMNYMKEKLFDDVTPQYVYISEYRPFIFIYYLDYGQILIFIRNQLGLIKEHGDSIPIGIFLRGIVISTYQETVLEWIDNEYGPVGITASVLMGLIFKEDFCIYNYVSKDNPISYGGYVEMILRYRDLILSEKILLDFIGSNIETCHCLCPYHHMEYDFQTTCKVKILVKKKFMIHQNVLWRIEIQF
uniref:Fatty acyl-CoA reductase n=1 Tax=Vespula pensylvanica TaxID=30213 RepID=A0A834K138_VESPE|nr:hypothetical protein H0235_016341 [Vespula pensylvanica]